MIISHEEDQYSYPYKRYKASIALIQPKPGLGAREFFL